MQHVNKSLDTVKLRYCVFFATLIIATNTVAAVVPEMNSIEQIQVSPAGVEIQLHSSRTFPVRAIPPWLRVGSKVFKRSHRPASGDLNRLIFLLPHRSYARLRGGDAVQVLYGDDASPRAKWDFGTFPSKNRGRNSSTRSF